MENIAFLIYFAKYLLLFIIFGKMLLEIDMKS